MTKYTIYIWAITIASLAPSYGSADTIAAEVMNPGNQAACVEPQPGTFPQTLKGGSLATTVPVTQYGESMQSMPTSLHLPSEVVLQSPSVQIDRDPSSPQLPGDYEIWAHDT